MVSLHGKVIVFIASQMFKIVAIAINIHNKVS